MTTPHYCNLCEANVPEFLVYSNRKNALCKACGSLERQRLFKHWFDGYKTNLRNDARILHFAPEKCVTKHLMEIGKKNYLSVDIQSGRAMKVEDITKMSFADNSFDFIFCSHVLHHIVDDDAAIKELYRVLDCDGSLLLINSIENGPTKEVKYDYFKRVYNKTDLYNKLTDKNFKVKIIDGKDLIPSKEETYRLGVSQGQLLFICTK